MQETVKNKNQGFKLTELGIIFRSLRYKNFRLFFSGQIISLIGTWMQTIAMSWLVYRITNSALILGMIAFSSQIFSFFLSPFIGVFVDRYNRHRMLIITQSLSMLQAFILFFLASKSLISVWLIILLSMFLGIINSFDIPTRQSFIVEMVENKKDLANAIALNSFIFNAARLVGPSVAGMLIALTGENLCFLINGLSYIAVIWALLKMQVKKRAVPAQKGDVLKDFKEGFSYTFGFLPIKAILFLTAVASLTGMSYAVLMPVFAVNIFGGGPQVYGLLMAAIGIGAIAGTLYLASHQSVVHLANKIWVASAIFGASLIVFSFSHNFWFSLFILLIAGFSMMVQLASSNTVVQTIVDDNKRGRVMSFYAMCFMGVAPFGGLLSGYLAHTIGAPNTLILGGFCSIAGAMLFAAKSKQLKEALSKVHIE
ncbi:MAG: MFS transporter [Candidatus Omnitrophica bacterium]|nr:MFS transporter [Candidatus Omnitrophota bacterium]